MFDSEKRLAQELNMARQEAERVTELARMGVKFGTPVTAFRSASGCSSCIWHVESADGLYEDGGNASSIVSWIKQGYLGDPRDLTIRPVEAR